MSTQDVSMYPDSESRLQTNEAQWVCGGVGLADVKTRNTRLGKQERLMRKRGGGEADVLFIRFSKTVNVAKI